MMLFKLKIDNLKVKEWKTIYHANKHNKARVTILIADKMVFKARGILRDNEDYFIVIKLVVF